MAFKYYQERQNPGQKATYGFCILVIDKGSFSEYFKFPIIHIAKVLRSISMLI